MRIVSQSRRPSNQFLVDGVANLDWGDLDWSWRWLSVASVIASKRATPVVVDITSITRSTFGAIADSHANGGLFVGGVTAPVGFPANAASSVFGNSTKAVDSKLASLRKVDDPTLVGIRSMN